MRKLTIIAIGLALSLGGAAVVAQPMGPPPGERGSFAGHHGPDHMGAPVMRMAHMLLHVGEELGVTEEQRDQIHRVLEGARAELQPLRLALRENREALRAVSTPESYDPAEVGNLAAVHGELTAELAILGTRVKVDVLNVLTEEQRARLEAMREERRSRFQG